MRVGIVTIWDNENMGNRLQNYALSRVISRDLGCEATTLVSYPFKKPAWIQCVKENIAVKSSLFPHLAAKRFGINVVKYSRFLKWNRNIPSKFFFGVEGIPETFDEKFDYFLSGSDQIWNHTLRGFNYYDYFLQFADPDKRIAVAASIGLNEIEKEWEKGYAEQLRSYKAISVREERAKEIVSNVSGCHAEVISDPVMAVKAEDWRKVSARPRVSVSDDYILVYMLGDISDSLKEKIDKWKRIGNCVVYRMLDEDIFDLFTCGPAEFISLVDNAKLVVTDSFHCTAMSIILSTPFVSINRVDKLADMSNRMDTLLKKYNYEKRRASNLDNPFQCDFSHTDSVIENERSKFIHFLKGSMNMK